METRKNKSYWSSRFKNATFSNQTFSHLKMDGLYTTFLLGRPILRGYVSFREGNMKTLKTKNYWINFPWVSFCEVFEMFALNPNWPHQHWVIMFILDVNQSHLIVYLSAKLSHSRFKMGSSLDKNWVPLTNSKPQTHRIHVWSIYLHVP